MENIIKNRGDMYKDLNKRRETKRKYYIRNRDKIRKRKLEKYIEKVKRNPEIRQEIQKRNIVAVRKYRNRKLKGSEYYKKQYQKEKKKRLIRKKAHYKYGYGKLPKGLEYHHPDYTKPWMFQILTTKKHHEIHRKY